MKAARIFLPLLLIVCLFGCKGAEPVSDPKVQAQKLLEVFHKEDWKGLGDLIAFPSNITDTDTSKFAEGFKKGLDSTGNGALVHQLFGSMKDIKVGEATVTGEKATVPTTCTFTVMGQPKTFSGVANLAKAKGVWKWDLTGGSDMQAETTKQLVALIGKPKA